MQYTFNRENENGEKSGFYQTFFKVYLSVEKTVSTKFQLQFRIQS